jgi:lycopene beta-cyclase
MPWRAGGTLQRAAPAGPQGRRPASNWSHGLAHPHLPARLPPSTHVLGVRFLTDKVDSVSHAGGRSTVTTQGGAALRGSMVLDATGHSRRLVKFGQKFDPGYQGAYGIVAEVESHPFDIDTMLFMDWRDNHLEGTPDVQARNAKLPTFLYAMPFSKTK